MTWIRPEIGKFIIFVGFIMLFQVFDFEYMTGKDTFQWISLSTDQAVLLSLLFQSVGNEILNEFRNMSVP